MTSPNRFVRLRDRGHDLNTRIIHERFEERDREGGRAEEDDFHIYSFGACVYRTTRSTNSTPSRWSISCWKMMAGNPSTSIESFSPFWVNASRRIFLCRFTIPNTPGTDRHPSSLSTFVN